MGHLGLNAVWLALLLPLPYVYVFVSYLISYLRGFGGIFALHAHCALLLDNVPPEEPPSTPLGNALRIR